MKRSGSEALLFGCLVWMAILFAIINPWGIIPYSKWITSYSTAHAGPPDFRGRNLVGVDFRDRDLRGANFTNANLVDANFAGANLAGANLDGVTATHADFNEANLQGIITNDVFIYARFDYATFRGADLRGSKAYHVNFQHADFTSANVTGANFDNCDFAWDVVDEFFANKKAK